jgi:hypothetical protein
MDSADWLVAWERFLRNAWELKPVGRALSWPNNKKLPVLPPETLKIAIRKLVRHDGLQWSYGNHSESEQKISKISACIKTEHQNKIVNMVPHEGEYSSKNQIVHEYYVKPRWALVSTHNHSYSPLFPQINHA